MVQHAVIGYHRGTTWDLQPDPCKLNLLSRLWSINLHDCPNSEFSWGGLITFSSKGTWRHGAKRVHKEHMGHAATRVYSDVTKTHKLRIW